MDPYPRKARRLIFALALATSSLALGQVIDVPLRNWTVPPYRTGSSSQSGLTTMTVPTQGVGYVAIQPCRVVDTRNANGPYGGPILPANILRTFDIDSSPTCTGIPGGVDAYSLNVAAVTPSADGYLKAWPTGEAEPTSSDLNFLAGKVIANALIVPAGTSGSINIIVNISTHILIDINGYFTDTYNPGTQFLAISSVSAGGAIAGTNSSTTNGSSGVYGLASGTSGTVFGVLGKSSSQSLDSAGVKGIDVSGSPQNATTFITAGVRGESLTNLGVLGVSQSAAGVQGTLVNSGGAALAEGKVGVLVGGTYYALYGATGDIGVTGTKSFVVPHPTEPGVVIRFISLEGPEAGTYFRGRGRVEGREATIEIPESFRLVTEQEGLSIQLTPIGRSGSLWVEEIGLDRILIRGVRDVEFFYTVNGIRKGYGAFQSMAEGSEFVPESGSARLPEGLSPEAKRRLIANGTFNPDGTVNLETAERMGWSRRWAERLPDNH